MATRPTHADDGVPLARTDYSAASLECDIVMKGGITSGVVYPLAVCELAKTYRFRSIGGTSAGAIAAAATAAAEYGRRSGRNPGHGFQMLAGLPAWLGRVDDGADRSNLFGLFQPQPATDALFNVAVAPMLGRSVPGQLVQRFPVAAALGALPGVGIVLLGTQARPMGAAIALLVLGLLLAVGGGLLAAGLVLARKARVEVPKNGFGLCSGNGPDVDNSTGQWAALTPWLADLINRLAGKPRDEGPLTFADLWGTTAADGEHEEGEADAERDIDLRFMTTSLTHGRPYEFPFASRLFFYDPDELARYFPAWVLRGMNEKAARLKAETLAMRARLAARDAAREAEDPDGGADVDAAGEVANEQEPTLDEEKAAEARRLWDRLLPLPEARDLPIVLGARMSLSFPLLFSAVPLYAVDYMLPDDAGRAPERCWFSDGGICSNFPVHFFDSPLPARPTFGINLRPFPVNRQKEHDEALNTWFPMKNKEGITEWFERIQEGRWKPLTGFAGLIVNAMQNWVDNTQLSVPGYRDRVAHVLLTEAEGGLNLNMPGEVIEALGRRGQLAARELARRYHPLAPPPGMPLTWDNHRWVRLLSSVHLLEKLLGDITDGYTAPDASGRSFADLVLRGNTDPRSYRMSAARARDLDAAIRELQKLEFVQTGPLLAERAPRPTPELRIRPKL